jgi:DNA-directed RNA polymerase
MPSGGVQHAMIVRAHDAGALVTLYEVLDVLGATGWRIHKKVFEVLQTLWNSGESWLSVPGDSEGCLKKRVGKPAGWKEMSTAERAQWYKTNLDANRAIMAAFSQRCDLNYRLEVAKAVIS